MVEKHTGNITIPGMAAPTPITFNSTPTLALYDEKGLTTETLDDVGVRFWNSQGHLSGSLGNGILSLPGDGASGTVLYPGVMGVFDDQGFSATMGGVGLVTPRTGETRKTSAASIVLLDKNKNVLWKAP